MTRCNVVALAAALFASGFSGCRCGFIPVDECGNTRCSDAGPTGGDGGGSVAGDGGVGSGSDSGTSDSGTPEVCDGIDNDLDGLIDAFPDGGPLTGPEQCPLTLGVCSTGHSYCIDGGFTACSYGPDYQRTETKCDGLDNDCDGRIDKSWPRILFGADAGWHESRLTMTDVWEGQVIVQDGGIIMNFPAQVLVLSDDLFTRTTTRFLPATSDTSRLGWNGASWTRAVWYTEPSTSCITLQKVPSNGGLITPGDLVSTSIARACWGSRGWGSAAAVQSPDGWRAAADLGGGMIGWAAFNFDGGTSQGTANAAILYNNGHYLDVRIVDDNLLITNDWFASRSRTAGIQIPGGQLTYLGELPYQGCKPARISPMLWACLGAASTDDDWYWTWVTPDAGVVYERGPGYPAGEPWTGSSDLGLSMQLLDAGWPDGPATLTLTVFTDAGVSSVETLKMPTTDVLMDKFRVHKIRAGLVLLTRFELTDRSFACTACPIDSFTAEYLCVPP